ncbi:TlpA family protein disulfide reductase [Blastopirellula marina]|nr:TlpA disulfide reductase family protein [Blastopirellula marina]
MKSVFVRPLLLLTTLTWLLPFPPAMAQETPAEEKITPRFAAFAIETDLQRELIGRPEPNIYLAIDAAPIVEAGWAKPDYVLSVDVQQRLREIIHDYSIEDPEVTLWVSGPHIADIRAMTQQMKQIFADSTFKPKLKLNSTYFTSDHSLFNGTPSPFLAPDADAKPVDRQLAGQGFEAFVVTSDLARQKSSGADIYITLHQPITRDFEKFSPEMVARLKAAVDELDPAHRQVITIKCETTLHGQQVMYDFTSRPSTNNGNFFAPQPLSKAELLAEELGFKNCRFGIHGLRFSPEDLMQRKAPNFQLSNQEGEMVDFHEITKGKVTLLNFSGIACPPCQKEAPHLTALQKEFADQGVKVISVNGYNELLEEIQANMKRLSLEHETLVMGRGVANGQYKVYAYPLTFFLDENGIIRDFHLDFKQGDEAVLKEKIAKLLKEKED